LFATFASFETCTGGGWFSRTPRICVSDYSKGLGRLVVHVFGSTAVSRFFQLFADFYLYPSFLQVSFQCIFGGLFYLMTAVVAWNDYWAIQQEDKSQRQMAALTQWQQQQNASKPSTMT
jgi:hypothetical protein